MSEIFFISDNHFGHENILTYEAAARPFATILEMNETMIHRWNSVVGKYDKVYHLGDFCFGKRYIDIAGRLNGQKRLILGNHDAYPINLYLKYFLSVHGAMYLHNCLLTHVPVHPDNLGDRAMINIHGHLHSKLVELPGNMRSKGSGPVTSIYDSRYVNVSCEQNNLTPINADLIWKR